MARLFERARIPSRFVNAMILLASTIGLPVATGQDKPPPDTKLPVKPVFEIGDSVGKVTKVGPGPGEVRIDFGREKGAQVGMRLGASRPDPNDRMPNGQEGRIDLGTIELISVEDRESVARRDTSEDDEKFFGPRPAIQAGDGLWYKTDNESLYLLKLAMSDSPDAVRELQRIRVDLARRAVEVTKSYLDTGTVTLDRYIAASQALMAAERDAAPAADGKVAAIRAHVVRISLLADQEAYRLQIGQGSIVNVSEARQAMSDAAVLLAGALRGKADAPAEPRGADKAAPPPADKAQPKRSGPVVGDTVGRVTKVDRDRTEARINFGRDQGAQVGMMLLVEPDPDRPANEPAEFAGLTGQLRIESVEAKESVAKITAELSARSFDGGQVRTTREIRPGDVIMCLSDEESSRVFKLAVHGGANALSELNRTRLRDLRELAKLTRLYFESGTVTVDRLLGPSRRLMEAERDVASSQAEDLAAIRGQMERVRRLIESEVTNFKFEHPAEPQVSEARSDYATAAMLLHRARLASAAKGPSKGSEPARSNK